MALFITFEGGEGTGKSLQIRLLKKRLSKLGIPVLLTYEPGGTSFGRRIARLLKWSQDVNISPVAELILFNASRAQLVDEVLKPALKDGKVVICDRYADSTTAYQGYGRGLNLEMVKAINEAATGKLEPALTILLDMPVEEGLARKRLKKPDRFEQEDLAFHQRVRGGYLKMVANDPQRWLVVDGRQPKGAIAEIIWLRVSKLISEQGKHG